MLIPRYIKSALRFAPSLFIAAMVLPAAPPAVDAQTQSLAVDSFDQGLSGWDVQTFEGATTYRIVVDEDGNRVLFADSHAGASGLIKRISIDPHGFPLLRWRWKINGIVTHGDARTKEGDDYAARIYVVFPHWIKPLTRTINYIWANQLPTGEAVPNPYFSRAMMLAVESGNAKAGQWINEERNIVDDFRRLFGEDPPQVGGVAIMTDTDNTGSSAQAWYDDLAFFSPQ
ncbi:MAG: DUF3047 domain-containing protein [Desulfuromonadales bacterium]|nr:DUF3047 domain-containing protein [Desulfuromonadales bacterium]MBN2793372.1 DUF3047 domain-containing protein [Desulfuromonadales bacterium]